MANPTLLTQPFAANGDKNVIPNTTTVQGAFSQDKGFPAECSLPLGAGGVAPSRQDFNGAFNLLSALAYYAQKGYTWHWEAGQEYFVGCVVIDETDGKIYECISDVASGGSAPSADTTHWQVFLSDRFSQYLPLNGGQMTGNSIVTRDNNSGVLILSGGANHTAGASDGGRLGLYGRNFTELGRSGAFTLTAMNGSGAADLIGSPNGSLIWTGSGRMVEIKSMAFPSATKVNVPIPANGQNYTAPANGYYFVDGNAISTPAFLGISCNGIATIDRVDSTAHGTSIYTYIPMKKGDVARVTFANANMTVALFIYAEGEV